MQLSLAAKILVGELLDFSLFSVKITVSVKVSYWVETDRSPFFCLLCWFRLWQALARSGARLSRFLTNQIGRNAITQQSRSEAHVIDEWLPKAPWGATNMVFNLLSVLLCLFIPITALDAVFDVIFPALATSRLRHDFWLVIVMERSVMAWFSRRLRPNWMRAIWKVAIASKDLDTFDFWGRNTTYKTFLGVFLTTLAPVFMAAAVMQNLACRRLSTRSLSFYGWRLLSLCWPSTWV